MARSVGGRVRRSLLRSGVRAATSLGLALLLTACGKAPADAAANAEADSPAKDGADAASAPSGEAGLAPALLQGKFDRGACSLTNAQAVQAALALPSAPSEASGTADKPTRAYCRYSWDEDGQPRHLDVAWATALQDKTDTIAKGRGIAEQDVAERRLQGVEVPGVSLATWGEQWLTVYANDRQVFWVVMEGSGKTPRDGRAAATAVAQHVVK